MQQLQEILDDNNKLSKIIISKSIKKEQNIHIKKVQLQKKVVWQSEQIINNQAYQKNFDLDQLFEYISQLFPNNFRQINILSADCEYSVFCSKKGKISIIKNNKNKTQPIVTSHNKQKKYIFTENMDLPFMRDLGIFTQNNKIVNSMYDKFKQINKFVEILDHSFSEYNDPSITILDFGCGKSYLTFVVYYYFKIIKKINPIVIGYDLKESVVKECNILAQKYQYNNLHFFVNDVSSNNLYTGKVDMLITLHACDTATDYALKYAIQNNVLNIFSVPCCQHEINSQIQKGGDFDILLDDGILKERTSALLTDAIRARILRDFGYSVNIFEFVDFSHSPKNLMLKCKLISPKTPKINTEIQNLIKKYNFSQTLYNELYKK